MIASIRRRIKATIAQHVSRWVVLRQYKGDTGATIRIFAKVGGEAIYLDMTIPEARKLGTALHDAAASTVGDLTTADVSDPATDG